jgi:hypothetical protein
VITEAHDEWQVLDRRYLSGASMALFTPPELTAIDPRRTCPSEVIDQPALQTAYSAPPQSSTRRATPPRGARPSDSGRAVSTGGAASWPEPKPGSVGLREGGRRMRRPSVRAQSNRPASGSEASPVTGVRRFHRRSRTPAQSRCGWGHTVGKRGGARDSHRSISTGPRKASPKIFGIKSVHPRATASLYLQR